MPNLMDTAFASLRSAFQTVTGATPTLTFGAQVVSILPGEQGVAPMFFDGGSGDGAELTVQTLASDWSPAPVKQDVVALAAMASGPAKSYQVLATIHREGTITFTLGNLDAR